MNLSRPPLDPDSEARSSSLATFPSSAKPIRLAIRLWSPARLDLGWRSDSQIIHLISDLISASDGTPGEESARCLVAYFDHSSSAFRCAKRIQWALLEFCQHRPQLCLGAAAIVYGTCDLTTGSEEGSLQSVSATLGQAKPTQILMAASVEEQLHESPGLQVRDFTPLLGSADWRGGVRESIWTTPSNLERLQEVLKSAAQNLTQGEPYVAASQPTMDFAATDGRRPTQSEPLLADPIPPSNDADRSIQTQLIELEPVTERSGARILWWALAGVAVLAVLAAVVLLPGSRRNATGPPALVQPVATPDTEAVKAEPSSAPSPSTQEPPTQAPKESDEQAKSPTRNTSTPTRRESPKKAAEYDGLTEKDIPRLIRMAQSDAGAGNYDDARREFNAVLHLDPNNQEARVGLRKVDMSEKETR